MYGAPAAFFEAIRDSHPVTSRVEVLSGGRVMAVLDVTSGSVRCRSAAGRRRTLNCTLGDPTGALTPSDLTGLLAPNGNELRAFRGTTVTVPGTAISAPSTLYDSATTYDDPALPYDGIESGTATVTPPTVVGYEVPLGVFGIDDVDISSDVVGGTKIQLTAFDRSQRVDEDQFYDTHIIAEGTNYADAIRSLIERTWRAGVVFKFEGTSLVTPRLVFDVGASPWAEAEKMALSIGCELFFDADGNPVMRSVPDPDQDPVVWTYAEGEDALILTAGKKLSRRHTFNGVIATGESSAITDQASAPVAAIAWDDNPASPTYYLGRFGRKSRRYSSPFITTQVQAASAARAILRQSLGVSEDVSFTGVVNPAHEPGDVVQITVAKSKINARYVLDEFAIPLTHSGTLDASTRRRTT